MTQALLIVAGILCTLPALSLVLARFVGAMPCAATDWLPSKDADLDAFAVNFHTLIAAAPATYGLVAGDATALDPFVTAYTAALTAATDPSTRTSVTVAAKDVARFNLKAELRELAAKVQASPTVTDGAKTALGLTVRDTAPSPISAPATNPIVSVNEATPLAHYLRFSDSLTPDSRAKPVNVVGMELYVSPSATVISDPEDLKFNGVVTRNPYVITYDAADAGKKAYIAGRWINAKGQRGPWSGITSMTIAA